MREILFRGKRKDNGEWVEGDLLQDKDLEKCYIEYFDYCSGENGLEREYCQCEVIPETVGQFTGLIDKNGKKIFEGDIVQHDFGAEQIGVQYAVVEYDSKYASFMIKPLYDWMYCEKDDCEVIGNIQDSPNFWEGGY